MKTTTENNKIIAEFMGLDETKMFFNLKTGNYVKKETDDCDIKAVDVYLKNNKPITNFYYHSDWNWLMEVVEKIEGLGFKVNIFGFNADLKTHYIIIYNSENGTISVVNEQGLTKIKAVYNACIAFINWHNKQG